ncbi:N-acetylmuramoyl-L-alanine amidase [bacterium]|nr:N-acetylmuramoyl-L-alanine amidase [bacterium]
MGLLDFIDLLMRWTFANSLKASVLAGLIVFIQWLFKNRLSAGWLHALWFILIIRLLLPAGFESHFSMYNLIPQKKQVIVAADPEEWQDSSDMETKDGMIQKSADNYNYDDQPFHFAGLLPVLWFTGVLVLLTVTAMNDLHTRNRFRKQKPVRNPEILRLFIDCMNTMHIRQPVRLAQTDRISMPLLYGWLKPVILLPSAKLERWNKDQIRHILSHELAHLKRRDIPAAHICTALQLLHWFNPLMWLVFYQVRLDREIACDAIALNSLGKEQARSYGQTILSMLESMTSDNLFPLTVGILESKRYLKNRLWHIMHDSKPRIFWTVAAALFMIVIGVAALTEAERKQDKTPGKPVVLIDPGHGGKDPGFMTPDGINEKDLNLEYGLYLQAFLESQGYTALLTRDTDTFINLNERRKAAEERNADIFISIHFGSARDPSYHGAAVYCGKYDPLSRMLATHVLTQVRNMDLFTVQPVREANFIVLNQTPVPSVLVEAGYMTSTEDMKLIGNPEYMRQFALCIQGALESYNRDRTSNPWPPVNMRLDSSGRLTINDRPAGWQDLGKIISGLARRADTAGKTRSETFQKKIGNPGIHIQLDEEPARNFTVRNGSGNPDFRIHIDRKTPMHHVYRLQDSLRTICGEVIFPDGMPPDMHFDVYCDSLIKYQSETGKMNQDHTMYKKHLIEKALQAYHDVCSETEKYHPGPCAILQMKYACLKTDGISDIDFDQLAVVSGTSALFAHDPDDFMPKYANLYIGMDRRIADATGIQFERVEFGSIDQAWEALKASIDIGKPVIGWHWENVLFCGYKEAADNKDRRIFTIAVGPSDYEKWWTWKDFEEWFPQFGYGHFIRYAHRTEPLPETETAIRILTDLVDWSASPPENIRKEYPNAVFGLAGMEAWAVNCRNTKLFKNWTACHDMQPQWGPRHSTSVYLKHLAESGLFPEAVGEHLADASRAYDSAYRNWQEMYHLVGWAAPGWAGRMKRRRHQAADAVDRAHDSEKQGIGHIRTALQIMGRPSGPQA